MKNQALTQGIHHLGLTVRDCKKAAHFFVEALGFSLLKEREDYPASFVSDGKIMLTLWQVQNPKPQEFDRKNNLGLHHFALQLCPEQSLDDLEVSLKERDDVHIEFGPEMLGTGPQRHMMCELECGVRLELFAN